LKRRAADAYTTNARSYWEYQRPIGRVGGELNRWKFEPHLTDGDVVVDFGCGGGYLLARLPGQTKIGVDPSPLAREEAAREGIHVVESTAELPDSSTDVVISNHALEHTFSPFEELRDLARILRPGGKLVMTLPVDDWRAERRPDPHDPNGHLYAWTPLLIANLLTEAGFDVESARVSSRAWDPRVTPLVPAVLRPLVDWLLAVALRRREIFAVARKPSGAGSNPGAADDGA